jgi:hypothetical protein
MPPLKLSVDLVPLVSHTEKRAVAFLRGCEELDAGPEFDKVANGPIGKRVKHKMQLWISLKPDTAGKFHRFKNAEAKYAECFVFIDLDAKIRFYGFTCHPTPHNPHFELIVLVVHAIKKESQTDKAELNRVLMWKNNMATRAALLQKYPEKKLENG